jgi:bacterioferritin-associated ferredoxin
MYVCICNPVTDSQVRNCARRGACTLSELQMELGVALQCGSCASTALAIVEEVTRTTTATSPAAAGQYSAAA